MLKKESLVIVACVILFVILVALLCIEMSNPEGGVELVAGIMSKLFGN